MIDTHTHLYLLEFSNDIDAVLNAAQTAGLRYALLPNIDSISVEAMHALVDRHPKVCFPMMGLHPCSVKENWEAQLDIVQTFLFKSGRFYCGVGEIGLDYYWDKTFVKQQQEAYKLQLTWAAKTQKATSIHTRDATDDAIQLFADIQKDNKDLRGVFHCFGGTLDQANRIVAMNCKLGIGGVVTYKKSGLDAVLKYVPLENIVLETDAPYLTPVPHRGKRNEPVYLTFVIDKLAEIYNCSPKEIVEQTDKNALELFPVDKV